MRQVEDRILDMDEFESVYARAGGGGSTDREDRIGSIQLQFVDWESRRPADEILGEIRERTGDIAGIEVETRTPRAGPPGSAKPITLELSSRFPNALEAAIGRIRAVMDAQPASSERRESRRGS